MTVVFVTHDVDEAIFLSDRVVVLTSRPGRIKGHLPVDLRRPRDVGLLTSHEFIGLKRQALELLTSAASAADTRSSASRAPAWRAREDLAT